MEDKSLPVGSNPSITISLTDFSPKLIGELRSALHDYFLSNQLDRQLQIIDYLIEETMSGRGDRIKAYSLAVDVFGQNPDFDPATQSNVRVEMHRLRKSLARFVTEGTSQLEYVLAVPLGQYVPILVSRSSMPTNISKSVPLAPPPASKKADLFSKMRGTVMNTRLGVFRPFSLISIAAIIVLTLSSALFWRQYGDDIHSEPVEELAPRLKIDVDSNDKNQGNLNEIAKLLSAKNPFRFPVSMSVNANADYILALSTFTSPDGVEMVEATLYDNERAQIFTESQPATDLSDLSQRTKISENIHDHFLSIEGYIAKDFDHNQNYSKKRRQIYTCYRDLNLETIGRSSAAIDLDENLACLDPADVAEPRDKALIYILRASVIAASASGLMKTKARYSMDDARAEVDAASSVYPNDLAVLGERIVLEWRDPHRDNQRLRTLLAKAQRGVMAAELRYNVAVSYVYYLGDFASGKRIAYDNTATQQGLRQSIGDLYYFIELPELMANGKYEAARIALEKTEAISSPTYALFKVAIACAQGDKKDITSSLELVSNSTVLNAQSLKEYAKGRNYAPNVTNPLLHALSSPSCSTKVA